MAIKPILFNSEMVRAILDGRKTQTRRLVKCVHRDAVGFDVFRDHDKNIVGVCDFDEDGRHYEDDTRPPCLPGDILWVRETWAYAAGANKEGRIIYKADKENGIDRILASVGGRWRPSIHIPREAARLFLRVKDVRVERLKDITWEDAKAEGAKSAAGNGYYIESFRKIWDSTIKDADFHRYGWPANPWVWVIEFERIDKPAGLWADRDTAKYADQDVLMPAT